MSRWNHICCYGYPRQKLNVVMEGHELLMRSSRKHVLYFRNQAIFKSIKIRGTILVILIPASKDILGYNAPLPSGVILPEETRSSHHIPRMDFFRAQINLKLGSPRNKDPPLDVLFLTVSMPMALSVTPSVTFSVTMMVACSM
jgi:hypothetical protein